MLNQTRVILYIMHFEFTNVYSLTKHMRRNKISLVHYSSGTKIPQARNLFKFYEIDMSQRNLFNGFSHGIQFIT